MKCFVIMPFAETFDPVFQAVSEVAASAVPETDFDCYWLKDVHAAGNITDDIVRGLAEATFCIADVTGDNPNVMWETRYAMALGKPTILIGQNIASLPFDLKSHLVLKYAPISRSPLSATIDSIAGRGYAIWLNKGDSSSSMLPWNQCPGVYRKRAGVMCSSASSRTSSSSSGMGRASVRKRWCGTSRNRD